MDTEALICHGVTGGKAEVLRRFIAAIDPAFNPDFSKAIIMEFSGGTIQLRHSEEEEGNQIIVMDSGPNISEECFREMQRKLILAYRGMEFIPAYRGIPFTPETDPANGFNSLAWEPPKRVAIFEDGELSKHASDMRLRRLGYEPETRFLPNPKEKTEVPFYAALYRRNGTRKKRSKK